MNASDREPLVGTIPQRLSCLSDRLDGVEDMVNVGQHGEALRELLWQQREVLRALQDTYRAAISPL